MFTGIVTHTGIVCAVETTQKGKRFTIAAELDYARLALGASIAHAGVCLSVTQIDAAQGAYQVEAWEEALRLSTAGSWRVDSRLNLECPLKMGDELGGHLVLGHIDGVAEIVERKSQGGAIRFKLKAPLNLSKFIAPKGSVALDGVSLTVNRVEGAFFDVLLIGHTLAVTTWGQKQVGEPVNLEVDMMARYIARLMQAGSCKDG